MGILAGKTAIITGASKGIGREIAKKYALEGADIAFTYLSSVEKGIELEEELSAAGKKMIFHNFTAAMLWKNKEIQQALLHKGLNFNDLNQINLLSKNFKGVSELLV